jgi:RNA polymerase sigma factor (sigma-70 family)
MLRRYPDPLVDDHAMRAIRCSVRKAIHRGWFPRDEFEDLVQDAIVHLLRKIDCFDPCRASWATFCSMVVRSFLSRRYRSQCAQANVVSLNDRRSGDQSGFDAGHVEEQHCVGKRFQRIRTEIEWLELEDDISQMVASLPDELREMCELFQEETCMADVAARMGVSRNTVYRRRRMIRESIQFEYMAEYC